MSRTPEAKTRRNAKKHKIEAIRQDYANITGNAILDMSAGDMAVTTDGEVDPYGRFTGHYTLANPNGRRDRTNYAAGSTFEDSQDWRAEIISERAQEEKPLDKLIVR